MRHRVVITGAGIASPIGNSRSEVSAALQSGRTGIVTMPEWDRFRGISTRLGGTVKNLELKYPRKHVRTMGRVSLLALHATHQALAEAGLVPEALQDGRTGISYGSTHGSSSAMADAMRRLFSDESTFEGMASSSYFKFMTHTVPANLAIYFGIKGRIHTTCSACTSGSQGIGYGYETIRDGLQDVMICGGAEEMHVIHAGVFDLMYATSTRYNDRPALSPRPYDRERDGLVVGEGAGTVVLESYEHARARGAPMLAEVIGYGTNCDGVHATAPSAEGMEAVMRLALRDARLDAGRIDYVNGHGTATEAGDIAETIATHRVFGSEMPISSTKSHTGHTLGACGAIETIFCVQAMHDGFLPPTRNLEQLDERCAALDYVRDVRHQKADIVMNNNFAFGGINTSLILGRVR